MTEKRFRTGKGIFEEEYPSETIIDNETGKTYYKGYGYYISSKEICKLLNEFHEENEQLKSDIILIEKRADTVYDEIEQIKKDLKVVLPVLLAIDFKMSVNECEVMNRLAELLDDDFVKGVECE